MSTGDWEIEFALGKTNTPIGIGGLVIVVTVAAYLFAMLLIM